MGNVLRHSVFHIPETEKRKKKPNMKISDVVFNTGSHPRKPPRPSVYRQIYDTLLKPYVWAEMDLDKARALARWARDNKKCRVLRREIASQPGMYCVTLITGNKYYTRNATSTSPQPSTESCSSETD